MPSIKKWLSRLRKRPPPEEMRLQPVFDKLPPELWHKIAEQLPLSAAASLAYTCKQAAYVFGTRSWEALRLETNKEQKLEFLSYFDEDFPKHWLCRNCGIYHRRKDHANNSTRLFKKPHCAGDNETMPRLPHNNHCSWIHLSHNNSYPSLPPHIPYLILRAHRLGPTHGLPPTILTATTKINGVHYFHDALLISNHLILRTQSLAPTSVLLPEHHHPAYLDHFYHFLTATHNLQDNFLACGRWHDRTPPRQWYTSVVLWSFNDGCMATRGDHSVCVRRVIGCEHCRTEYQAVFLRRDYLPVRCRVKGLKGGRRFVLVTRWLDLGAYRAGGWSREWEALMRCCHRRRAGMGKLHCSGTVGPARRFKEEALGTPLEQSRQCG